VLVLLLLLLLLMPPTDARLVERFIIPGRYAQSARNSTPR